MSEEVGYDSVYEATIAYNSLNSIHAMNIQRKIWQRLAISNISDKIKMKYKAHFSKEEFDIITESLSKIFRLIPETDLWKTIERDVVLTRLTIDPIKGLILLYKNIYTKLNGDKNAMEIYTKIEKICQSRLIRMGDANLIIKRLKNKE